MGRMEPLDETERTILDLEKRRFRHQAAKERAVRAELGLGATEYYLRLNALLEDQRAVAAEPALIRRLRDHRDRV